MRSRLRVHSTAHTVSGASPFKARESVQRRDLSNVIYGENIRGLAANFGTLGNQDDSAGLNSENMAKYPPSVVENPLSSTHTSFAIDALVIKIV